MITALARLIERHFLLLALTFSGAALIWPPLFLWIKPHIPLGLGIIMFGMGLTLEFADFKRVAGQKRLLALGVGLQFFLMPALAWILCLILPLSPYAALGVLLVGCCPSGTASNVIAYFAKADVPLSVVMTLVSTLMAPLCTPALVKILAGEHIAVGFWSMAGSVFTIVVLPLLGGLILRRLVRSMVRPLLQIFPSVSVLTIAAVIACIVALNQQRILTFPALIMLAVILHNGLGFASGFFCAAFFQTQKQTARTISIEVGMQNSGLAVALASTFFADAPAVALAGALFSLWQNIVGMGLAKLWSKKTQEPIHPLSSKVEAF